MQLLIGLLESNYREFAQKLDQIQDSNISNPQLHIDLITSDFTGNTTLTPSSWPDINSNYILDVHMMTSDPVDFLDICVQKGVNRVIAHIERLDSSENWIFKVQEKGLKIGLAIDLHTSIEKFYLPKTKFKIQILLMSVKAGWAGQVFDEAVLSKIKALRNIVGNSAEIIIDGGINQQTAKKCYQAGADGVVVNSWLWVDFAERYKKIVSKI